MEQTVRFLPPSMGWFHLDAPSSQAGARKSRGLDTRIGSRNKSQAKFPTAARRESLEDSMKRAFLLMVAPALLTLSIAQTPPTSTNTGQATVKGCLGGSEGSYTVSEDKTGHLFKIGSSSVDLKPHLGHDVSLIGQKTSGTSSDPAAAANDSLAVTDVTMISDHCAAAAATAPTAAVSTPGGEPAPPATTVSTSAETAVTPAAAATSSADATVAPAAAAPVAEAAVMPAAAAAPTADTTVTPAAASAATAPTAETTVAPVAAPAPPAETAVTPAAPAAAPTAIVSTPTETASVPAAHSRRRSEIPAAAAATTPAVTDSSSSEPAATPTATDTTPATTESSEPASAPAAVATKPAAPSKGWSLWLLLGFGALVLVVGIMFPFFNRWRKQKNLEQAGSPNLSFTREVRSEKGMSDQDGTDRPVPRKVA